MSIITNKLRSLVSQDRNRHEDQELSLNIDLTYITDRILAMSFPATGIEAAWRNNIQDVCQLLKAKHKNNFLVFNLSERNYEYDLLDNQIVCFPFKDHHAPPLHIIFQIVQNMDNWLKANEKHVATVHCIGGKGRTGLIVVCYLFYSGMFMEVERCLSFFAERRSAKGKGVTQPSQLRYVRYFCGIVSGKLQTSLNPLMLKGISVGPVPRGFYVWVEFHNQTYDETSSIDDEESLDNLIYSTYTAPENRIPTEDNRFHSECNVELNGDILVRAYIVGIKEMKGKTRIFRMQFHTGLVHRGEIAVPKSELDDLNKDKKKYPADFDLRLKFAELDQQRDSAVAYNMIFNQLKGVYSDMLRTKAPPLLGSVARRADTVAINNGSPRKDPLATSHGEPLQRSASTFSIGKRDEDDFRAKSVEWLPSSHRTPTNEFAKLKRAESSRFHHQSRGSVVGAHKIQLTGGSPQEEEKRLQEVFANCNLSPKKEL